MVRTRKSVSMLIGVTMMAAMLVVAIATPSNAGTAQVECFGDDSVLDGSPVSSQEVVDLLHSIAVPPIPAGEPFESELAGRVEPASVPPGSSALDFFMEIVFSQDLIDTALDAGITELNLSNIEFELEPGDGVSGPNLIGNPPDATIDLTGPIDTEQGPFTETYDITAPIGDQVSWDLVSSQIGISLTIPPATNLQFGLSCEKVSSDPLISAFVLDNDPGAPGVPAREAETDEDTPVDIDLLDGVTDGDAATDPDSVSIVGEPANGSVTLTDGIATYTPDAGFSGEDQFAYEVCTVPFTTVPAVNEITSITWTGGGNYNVIVDGVATAPLSSSATIPEIEAAIEGLSTVGAGNAVVTAVTGGYTVEFVGALAGTAVDVSVDDELFDGTVTVTETQAAVAAETGVACGSNVVTVTVNAADEPTPTTTPPPAAQPQAVPAPFTG